MIEALDAALPHLISEEAWPQWEGDDADELLFFGPLALSGAELSALTVGLPDREELLRRVLSFEPELEQTFNRNSLLALLPRLQAAALRPWHPPESIAQAFRDAVIPSFWGSN